MLINPLQAYKKLRTSNQDALRYTNLCSYSDHVNEDWTIPVQSLTKNHPEKPSQFIQKILEEEGCSKVWLGTNPKKPCQFILNLRFANQSQAYEFKKNHCERNILKSADGKTLMLIQETIPNILKKILVVHANTMNPEHLVQALEQEHRQESTLNTSAGFFSAPVNDNPVEQLIHALSTRTGTSTSFFQKSLISFLKELPHLNPSLIMSKLKDFTHAISSHSMDKEGETLLLISLILDPATENIRDLIEKLHARTTEECVTNHSSDNIK